MLTPKKYLSYSQMTTFEMSPEKYAAQYLYGEKNRISRNMAYGKIMADSLEFEELSGDHELDIMMVKLPKFEIMDKPIEQPGGVRVFFERDKREIEVPSLADGDSVIPLLAIPDTIKSDGSAFKEYKTSVRKWTQKMADDSGQITFYATTLWLKTNAIPQDIELVNVQVAYQPDGSLSPTGDLHRYQTTRTLVEIIKMTSRIKRAWAGIKYLCDAELIGSQSTG